MVGRIFVGTLQRQLWWQTTPCPLLPDWVPMPIRFSILLLLPSFVPISINFQLGCRRPNIRDAEVKEKYSADAPTCHVICHPPARVYSPNLVFRECDALMIIGRNCHNRRVVRQGSIPAKVRWLDARDRRR